MDDASARLAAAVKANATRRIPFHPQCFSTLHPLKSARHCPLHAACTVDLSGGWVNQRLSSEIQFSRSQLLTLQICTTVCASDRLVQDGCKGVIGPRWLVSPHRATRLSPFAAEQARLNRCTPAPNRGRPRQQ